MEHESYGMMIFRDKEAEEQFKNAEPFIQSSIADLIANNIQNSLFGLYQRTDDCMRTEIKQGYDLFDHKSYNEKHHEKQS